MLVRFQARPPRGNYGSGGFLTALSGFLCRTGFALSVLSAFELFIISMLFTCQIRTLNPAKPTYPLIAAKFDPILVNIIVLVGMLLLITALCNAKKLTRLLVRIPPVAYAAALMVVFFVGGCLFSYGFAYAPTGDANMVTTMGAQFLDGNYFALINPGSFQNYLYMYPYQLNLIGFFAAAQALVGVGNYVGLACINAFCLALTAGAVVRLCTLLISDRRVLVATVFLLATFLPAIPFCTFLYTFYPMLAALSWSVVFFIRYLETNRPLFLLPALLLGAVSVFLKINSFLFIIAMTVVAFLHTLQKRKVLPLVFSFALIVCSLASYRFYPNFCAARAGVTLAKGYPFSLWAQIGLTEGHFWLGWYNSVDYSALPADHEAVCEEINADIRLRLTEFAGHPADALSFFVKKTSSMWDEPTFETMGENARLYRPGDRANLRDFLSGSGGAAFYSIMRFYMQLFYFMLLAGLIACLRDACLSRDPKLLLIPLIFFGAVLYHTVFEIKSKFAIPYLLVLMPFAGFGLVSAARALSAFLRRIPPARRIDSSQSQKPLANTEKRG